VSCFALLLGNTFTKFRDGVRTVRDETSYIRRHVDWSVLGDRHVLLSAAGLPYTELGSSSTDHQPSRSALLVRMMKSLCSLGIVGELI